MGKRGPKPKSPELEAARGFPGRRKGRTEAALKAKKALVTLQHQARDSRFVPTPPCTLGKRALRLWEILWSDPATTLLFKSTDQHVIAEYCSLLVDQERDIRIPPKPVIEHKRESRTPEGGTAITTKIVRNPAYDVMLTRLDKLARYRSVLGLDPASRLAIEAKLGAPHNPGAPPVADDRIPGEGPLGVLKSKNPIN